MKNFLRMLNTTSKDFQSFQNTGGMVLSVTNNNVNAHDATKILFHNYMNSMYSASYCRASDPVL